MQHRMCALVLAMTAVAGMAASAADRPLVGPVPDWVQPATTEPPPAAATDAALLILLNDQQVRLAPDAIESYSDTRIRIQTPQGLQALGTITLSWQPDNDVITVHRLSVRRDSQVRDLLGNGDNFTILRREDRLEQATLTGTLTALLQPTDLQVGDIVEFSFTQRHADPVVPDKPSLQFAWMNSPIQTARFRAQWPRQMDVRWQARDFKPATQESTSGSSQSIAFTLENPPPLLQPVGAPVRFTALRRLELTAFQSWPEVSRRLAPLYVEAARLAADSPLRAGIDRIRAGSREPKAQAAAALKLVQENVRYVLLAMNDGALKPATADETWQRRYGDCKAKTALLLALLRELKIDAEPVAVNSVIGDGVDRMLPGISAFDHVLVRSQIGGKAYWLDGTRLGDRNLDQLQIPSFGWGLPLTARGSELVRIQPAPLSEPHYVQEITLDASGGADKPAPFQGSIVFHGDDAFSVKLSQDNLDATQRDQGMRNYWRNRFDDLQLTRVAAAFDEASGALTWTAEGTLRMDWSEGGYFELDDMQLGYKADFARPEGTDVEAPYAVSFPDYNVYRATVKLGQDYRFSVSGKDINQTLAGREYRRTARIANGVFTAEASSRSLVAEIAAREAHAAESDLREMYKNRLFIQRQRLLPSAAELQSQAGKPLATADEYVSRGGDMMNRSMFEPAVSDYTAALKLEPDNQDALANRGNAYFNLKRYDEARADLARVLVLDPKDDYALGVLGAVALKQGKTAEAIELLNRSIEIEDSDWKRGHRADAYLASGSTKVAAQDLFTMYRRNPFALVQITAKANDLVGAHRIEDVRIWARSALEDHVGPGDGSILAAELYRIAGDDALARDTLTNGITKAPTPELYVALAGVERKLDGAVADLKKALELNPRFEPALRALSGLQTLTRDFPAALDTLDRLQAVIGSTMEVHRLRATLLIQMGEKDRARQSYAAARALARTSTDFNNLCWEQATRNVGLEDALKDCDSALSLQPGCGPCLDSRGFVLLQMGRNEDAVAEYDKSIALVPRQSASLFGRGIAKLRLNKVAEGEADIAAALEISPSVERTFATYGVKR